MNILDFIEVLLEHIDSNPEKRIVIGVGGIPGSGKTSTSKLIKETLRAKQLKSVILQMDGYHYPKSVLDGFSDPVEAHKRRGSPMTFDSRGFVDTVTTLVKEPSVTLNIPGWSHEYGDPIPNAATITPDVKVIIVEGLYLFLDEAPWNEIPPLLTFNAWIDLPIETAMERLTQRHIDTGLAETVEEAQQRIETNDIINARLVLDKKSTHITHTVVCNVRWKSKMALGSVSELRSS
ncbi:P-loop containing nucleoside triphosphate hydrolase protein [Globomyces pollinis-pini]|nr:P-loop containing nucleoside triphosphate hydrolase protein [Globomyces pollinis-pini]